ncbi:TIGR00266 family protein [Pseudobacteriovorax antillogorgiicola]|uniref:TIGR00266 family protein n=1 Tax=Pseudobacteriovorax antillogorgiicola TaxID=1513793 RepID=A0A1Y6C1W0_9BACT|nr:TIGR00266 family protein [Pseudobacteriovorax antillogorgiicola]TCS50743.1 uncharacterized protein (TIGR00266 family) [Pseudobacteriovorax antillogorgiicola]SMF41035.1 TIGR00266 family protein [Pseudobacteriovorax antillogorgiicola]
MIETIKGGHGFSYIEAPLPPGGEVITESGAMASMDDGIEMRTKLNGGFFSGLLMKFLGNESLFINRFSNPSNSQKTIILTQNTPGQICIAELKDETLFIQPGSFIAATKTVKFGLRWAGFASWIGGEGLFRIKISGSGLVWYGAYGAVVEKEINGEYLVDTGHLLSYPKTIDLKFQLSGGIFSSFFGGEGFLLRLEGKGKVLLQARSLGGLAGWLNPRFWG